jgi:hypothetical protein
MPGQRVEAHTTLDARLALVGLGRATVAVTGRNLLQSHHAEWAGGVSRPQRSVHGTVTLAF